jgi:hypothetical protein
VQCGGVHPSWFDGQQGCSQLSTQSFFNEIVSKGQIFILDFGGRIKTDVSHAHTQAQKKLKSLRNPSEAKLIE